MTLRSCIQAFGNSSMSRSVNTDQMSFTLTRVSHSVNQLSMLQKAKWLYVSKKEITMLKIKTGIGPASSLEGNDIIVVVTGFACSHVWLKKFGLAVGTFRLSL